jgi:hypothetical protein
MSARVHLEYYLDKFTFRVNRRTSRVVACSFAGSSSRL